MHFLQFINTEEGRIVVSTEKDVYTNSCDVTTNVTTVGSAALSAYTLNGEKYIKVTSTGTTANSGMASIGASITVVTNDRYKIRVKGYRGTNPAYIHIKVGSTDVAWTGAALPSSATTESWVEQIVTIPSAGAMTVGITWNTSVNGDIFNINEFEITKLTIQSPEYLYYVKDHLGNTRVTFTTVSPTESKKATLEAAPTDVNSDKANFLRYDNAKRINSHLFDRTNGSAPTTTAGYSQRLAGRWYSSP